MQTGTLFAAPLQPRRSTDTFTPVVDKDKLRSQGERIRQLRKQAHLSQEGIAHEVGVTMRAYQAWERGESEIRYENLTRLAEALKVTPDFIEYGRPKARGETPDMAKTLDIGAEILARLGEVQLEVASLATLHEELQRRQVGLYALIERLIANQVLEAAKQDNPPSPQSAPSNRRRRAR